MTVRVLIVEDSATMRAYLSGLLTKHKMEVGQARDGVQALEMLSPDHGFHVVVTDLKMPRLGGLHLIEAIRSNDRLTALPIIVLTSSEEDTDHERNLVAGANDSIIKPLDEVRFVAKVRNLATMRRRQEEAERASWTDPLTGLANRRYTLMRLGEEMDRCRRYGGTLSVALLDIDHFKKVNDTLGHATGDEVLVAVAAGLKENCRSTDVVSRWGGEEFLVVLPEMSLTDAASTVERFRASLASRGVHLDVPDVDSFAVTVSGGVAEWNGKLSADELIQQADEGLYAAKERGRNQLLMWQLGRLAPVGSA